MPEGVNVGTVYWEIRGDTSRLRADMDNARQQVQGETTRALPLDGGGRRRRDMGWGLPGELPHGETGPGRRGQVPWAGMLPSRYSIYGLAGGYLGVRALQTGLAGVVAGIRQAEYHEAVLHGTAEKVLVANLKLKDAWGDMVQTIPLIGGGVRQLMDALGDRKNIEALLKDFQAVREETGVIETGLGRMKNIVEILEAKGRGETQQQIQQRQAMQGMVAMDEERAKYEQEVQDALAKETKLNKEVSEIKRVQERHGRITALQRTLGLQMPMGEIVGWIWRQRQDLPGKEKLAREAGMDVDIRARQLREHSELMTRIAMAVDTAANERPPPRYFPGGAVIYPRGASSGLDDIKAGAEQIVSGIMTLRNEQGYA